MGRIVLGMVLVLAWQWACRRVWQRWRAFGPVPADPVRRSR